MKKNKNGVTTYKTSTRVPTGQKNSQIEDTNNELTESPKIHVSTTPSAFTAVHYKISDMLSWTAVKALGVVFRCIFGFSVNSLLVSSV